MKQDVQNAINKRLESFKDVKSLLSLYKTELDTNKGYNGRQLLEMFQNCEDEGAHTVVIDLDTDNTLLEISNIGGNSFSLEGYDSLLYPGLSSKVSSGFIGNKGLGFRSIVNWANEINIISNGFRVSFKDSNKKNILLEILGYSEEDLDIIREKRRLKPTVYPIPLLNCGIIENLDQDHPYTTTISVCYDKSFEEDILGQIENISSMTLLFLKNINKVIIRVNGEEKIIEVRRSQENDLKVIYHDNEKYIVIEDEGIIDEEILGEYEGLDAKRYSVKIAFNFSLSLVDNVLYNYFRTQIPFELPFVAHASLELDQNRNHSTESPINDFVFEKLFKLHLKLIEILKFNNKSSWLPYRTIATETYKVYKYYEELINDDFENLEVYPTFSGIYQSKNNTYRLKNDISEFIQKKNLYCNVLDNIAIPCDEDLKALNYINETSDLDKKLEEIGQQITSYRIRAQYISLLIRNYGKQKFSVLLDADNNVIDKDDFVYTSKTNDNINLKVPYYSHIKFIHPNLYNVLIEALELNDEINKSRALADELAYISNVHSFEPQVVLKKIISETNIILEDNHKEKKK